MLADMMLSLSDIVSSVGGSSDSSNGNANVNNNNEAEKLALGADLEEDLNRTLYDIGAQDLLLDVWETMDQAEVRRQKKH